MSESADGLLTPCTRQNAGRLGTVTVSEIRSVPLVTSVESTMEVVLSKVRPFNAEHSVNGPEAAGFRSGCCAAISTTHARIAALTKKDAYFSIMARSIRRFNRAAESTLNPIVEPSPQTGEALETVMIRASVRECRERDRVL